MFQSDHELSSGYRLLEIITGQLQVRGLSPATEICLKKSFLVKKLNKSSKSAHDFLFPDER